MTDSLNRKPWPMKWVALAILVCVVPYTWVTVKYRKTTPAYQPYEDSKQRANVLRLLDAGYQRITVKAERPADVQDFINALPSRAEITDAPAGLADGLDETLVEIPQLPVSFTSVHAAKETAGLLPYPVVFTSVLGDQKHQLGGAQVFVREQNIIIVPQFEPLGGELTARTKESAVVITVPAGTLTAGTYSFVLCGSEQSRQWTVEVR